MNRFETDQGIPKITEFDMGGIESVPQPVSFVETIEVKDGVECDTYTFPDDSSKDLAVVRVACAHKTPLQRVVEGTRTTEGYIGGEGTLRVASQDGEVRVYEFGPGCENQPVEIRVGDIMQWEAYGATNLTFFEVCVPPYKDGRFENLIEE